MSEKKAEEKKVELIKSDKTKGHMLNVAPGCLAIELPAGYIQGDVLHTTAIVREMRGHEEDILAGKGPIVARLNAVIGNCLERLGEISDRSELNRAACSLTAQDRMAILIAIRRVSLGDFYDCKVTCPECKREQHISLNLAEIEIIPMPDRMKRERVDTLPSGKEVEWHVIRTEDEEWLEGQKKGKKNMPDILTLNLLSRVDSVGGIELDRSKAYKEAMSALKDLSIKDRSKLRSIFEKEEGTVDTDVEYECNNEECGHEWSGTMDVQAGFFFPDPGREESQP